MRVLTPGTFSTWISESRMWHRDGKENYGRKKRKGSMIGDTPGTQSISLKLFVGIDAVD